MFGRVEEEAYYKGFTLVRKGMVQPVVRRAPNRLLRTLSRSRMGNFEESTEVLQLPVGSRSEWYSRLTEEFYIQ